MNDASRSAHGGHGDRWIRLARKLKDVPSEEAQLPDSADARDSLSTSQTVPPQIRRLGDFELIEKLGEGGMGTVYLARQCSLGNKPVAVKVLPPYFAFDPKRIARFRTEAANGSKVNHPGIVSVLHVGEQDGLHFIVQELVEGGRSLAARIRETRDAIKFPKTYYRTTAELFIKIARALEVLHTANVIHRDIKPTNILLTPDDEPKLADFGLAKDMLGLESLTSGESPGTPCYKSPEQIDRRLGKTDARSDVFALGVTLYEALTFTRPFDGDDHAEIYRKIRYAAIESPKAKRPGVPDELALICMKALEKDAARRYGTAQEFQLDLQCYLESLPIQAKWPSIPRRLHLWAKRNVLAAALSTAGIVVLLATSTAAYVVLATNAELEAVNRLLTHANSLLDLARLEAVASAKAATRSEKTAIDAIVRARTSLATLIEEDAGNESAYAQLALLQDSPQRGIDLLEENVDKAVVGRTYFNSLAYLYLSIDVAARAREAAQCGLQRDPNYALHWYNLGRAIQDDGGPPRDVFEAFSRAAALNARQSLAATNASAEAYKLAGAEPVGSVAQREWDARGLLQARAGFERDPLHPVAVYNLAAGLINQGDIEGAIGVLEFGIGIPDVGGVPRLAGTLRDAVFAQAQDDPRGELWLRRLDLLLDARH